jgi:hypothetical protein
MALRIYWVKTSLLSNFNKTPLCHQLTPEAFNLNTKASKILITGYSGFVSRHFLVKPEKCGFDYLGFSEEIEGHLPEQISQRV